MLKTLNKWTLTFVVAGLLASMQGCGSNPRVVMIPPITYTTVNGEQVPTDLIKLGPDVKGRVYVFTKDGWLLSDDELVIPEGWLAAPPPPKKEN